MRPSHLTTSIAARPALRLAPRRRRPPATAGEARVQPRHPADPGGELLRLPRPGQRRPQGRAAARPAATTAIEAERHRARQAGRERADRAHHSRRRRRGDAAAEVAQEADRRAEGDCSSSGSPRGPSTSRTGRSSPPTRPTLPDGEGRGLGPQPDRPLRPRRSWRSAGLTPAPGGRPPHAGPPAEPRPDRPAARRRRRSRRSSTTRRRTPTRSYVDKLLASPQWGEHRGRYWLDAARYADTHGIHFDNYREIWAYRDWVINAFNQQHAVRPVHHRAARRRPAAEPRRSTSRSPPGFNRCNITTNEGGAIDEEYLVLYTRDRTETTSQVWLGLTAGCAVCHDHKFDPITQKEFYSLAAFFNNTTQTAMDGNIKDTPPIILVPRPRTGPRWSTLVKGSGRGAGQGRRPQGRGARRVRQVARVRQARRRRRQGADARDSPSTPCSPRARATRSA